MKPVAIVVIGIACGFVFITALMQYGHILALRPYVHELWFKVVIVAIYIVALTLNFVHFWIRKHRVNECQPSVHNRDER